MNLRLLSSLLAVALLPFPGCASPTGDPQPSTDSSAPPAILFAALSMTKQQQASSIPTDSGLLLRDPADGSWNRFGPKIQMISSATADPSDPDTVFLACGNGVVRTTNGGQSWRLVTGWRESDVLQLAINPLNGDQVYGATAWGVIRSRDGGDSWQSANQGLPRFFSRDIAIDARNPRRLLLATSTGLFESTDHAESWHRVPSFPKVAVLRLRQSQSHPDLWIAGTEGRGVWISRDNARTWQQAAPQLHGKNIYAVAIDPTNPSRLAAAGWQTGVHLSLDAGLSWSPSPAPLPSPHITAITFDPNSPHPLWASTFEEGTFLSADNGHSWSPPTLYGAYVHDLHFFPSISKIQGLTPSSHE